MSLLSSPKRGVLLGPDEQDRIYEKYISAKKTTTKQRYWVLELIRRLKELRGLIEETQNGPNTQQLQEKMSDADKATKIIAKQTSELHEHVEELATSTGVLKR